MLYCKLKILTSGHVAIATIDEQSNKPTTVTHYHRKSLIEIFDVILATPDK